MSRQTSYKFCIADDQNLCSCLWRIWTHKNEGYICPSKLGGQYKASFHSDGKCHVGLTSELRCTLYEPEWTGQSRHFDSWPRIISGFVERILELWIPTSHLGRMAGEIDKDAHLLKPAPEGFLTSIGLFRFGTNGQFQQIEIGMKEYLCSLPFADGSHLLVLKRELKEPFNLQKFISAHVRQSLSFQKGEKHYGSPESINPTDDAIRALLWTSDSLGKRLWIDSLMINALKT